MLEKSKTEAKKPSTKSPAKTATTTKPAHKKAASPKSKTASIEITPEQRQRMIEEAAYFIAERQGFMNHSTLEHWLAAEAEIDKQLSQKAR
jgi:hypothetical protein